MYMPVREVAFGAAFALALAAAGSVLAESVLAARTLRAGTVLQASDLNVGPSPDAASLRDTLVGQETRRAIYTGRSVTLGDVGPPTLVHRNSVVVMVYSRGGLGMRAEGRALESGGAGEPIHVLNLTSRQAVVGTVAGAGLVEVAR